MVDVPHIRVELLGTLCNGAEKWSMGFSTAPPPGGATADVEGFADTATSAFSTEVWDATGMNDYKAGSSQFLGSRVQQIKSDGTVLVSAESMLTSPSTGGATLAMPPQSSIVISLLTALAGPRHRGRMYFPALGTPALTATGRLQPAARNLLGTLMSAFLDSWNADLDTLPVGVASAVGNEVTTVNRIRVGDVIDTQRRRRDSLPEAFITEALA